MVTDLNSVVVGVVDSVNADERCSFTGLGTRQFRSYLRITRSLPSIAYTVRAVKVSIPAEIPDIGI